MFLWLSCDCTRTGQDRTGLKLKLKWMCWKLEVLEVKEQNLHKKRTELEVETSRHTYIIERERGRQADWIIFFEFFPLVWDKINAL